MPKQFKDKYNAVNITLCEKGDETFHNLRCVDRQCTECRAGLIMIHLQPLLEGHGHEVNEYTVKFAFKFRLSLNIRARNR